MSDHLAYLTSVLSRSRLAGRRSYPAIPQPTQDTASLQQSVEALKVRSETQNRESGNILDSVVTVRDLIQLGLIDGTGVPTE